MFVSLRLPLLRWCILLFPLLRRRTVGAELMLLQHHEEDMSTSEEWFYILMCGLLVYVLLCRLPSYLLHPPACRAFAGLMSGLTVGLMSIDPLKLELLRLVRCPNPKPYHSEPCHGRKGARLIACRPIVYILCFRSTIFYW